MFCKFSIVQFFFLNRWNIYIKLKKNIYDCSIKKGIYIDFKKNIYAILKKAYKLEKPNLNMN